MSLILSLLFCAFMCGIVWFLQIVHYPLMKQISKKKFQIYSQQHQLKTLYVVAPVMILEGLTAIWLLFAFPTWWSFLALLLVGGAWASTFGQQMPQHRILINGYDFKALEKLMQTNWIRVGCWSARSLLLAVMLFLKTMFL